MKKKEIFVYKKNVLHCKNKTHNPVFYFWWNRFLLFAFIILQSGFQDGGNKVSGVEINYWHLPTGSVIAYQKIGSESDQAQPVIFLHGGPGAYQLPIDQEGAQWLRNLGGERFVFYLYDQVGSGHSARLKNPYEYTVQRHVSDLEHIRKLTGNKKLILIGDSWGAILLANYAACYPENISKIVITSPGPIDPYYWWGEMHPSLEQHDLDYIKKKEGVKGEKKFVALQHLLESDLLAAYKFIGDSLMDRMYDSILNNHIRNTLVFNQNNVPTFKGMGWWASKMTIYSMTSRPEVSTKSKIKGLPIQALIVRGNHDYLPSGMAQEYVEVFPNARLIKIPDAGHMLWKEKPDVLAHELGEFILTN